MRPTWLCLFSFLEAEKAPAHQDDLAPAIFGLAHHRRHVPGEDGVHRFERGAAVVRDAEEAPDVILFGREGVEIAHPGAIAAIGMSVNTRTMQEML